MKHYTISDNISLGGFGCAESGTNVDLGGASLGNKFIFGGIYDYAECFIAKTYGFIGIELGFFSAANHNIFSPSFMLCPMMGGGFELQYTKRNSFVVEFGGKYRYVVGKNMSSYKQFNNINLVIASNLLLGEISAYLNKTNTTINNTKLTNERFIELVNKLDSKEISNKIFKEILDDIMESDQSIDQIIESKGLKLVSNEQDIINMINKVLDNNQELLNQYINGNDKASKALMGQVMKESHGSVDPSLANQLLNKILQSKRTITLQNLLECLMFQMEITKL